MELKGSKTEKNLWEAFAGESMARNKYTYFASVAKKEGYEQIAAIFLETAENERSMPSSTSRHFQASVQQRRTPVAAAGGENYEWSDMYRGWRKRRRKGFTELAEMFRNIARVEAEHEKRYKEFAKNPRKVMSS